MVDFVRIFPCSEADSLNISLSDDVPHLTTSIIDNVVININIDCSAYRELRERDERCFDCWLERDRVRAQPRRPRRNPDVDDRAQPLPDSDMGIVDFAGVQTGQRQRCAEGRHCHREPSPWHSHGNVQLRRFAFFFMFYDLMTCLHMCDLR